ncbi:MAG: S26 family signal peptidase [Candidatus Aminicenantes bacterium]|nr:S26 family signal peptidase [Candidatus Aminicenantes bacterium]
MADESAVEKPDEGISLSAPVIMDLIEAVHEKGASFRFQARGFSMTPAIRDGDVITVSPLGSGRPRRGDVLAFRHPLRPQLLVHRVLQARGMKYFIRGDSCPEADGWLLLENVIGIVTRVERNKKSVFWPDRDHAWSRFYFCLYTLWPPLRRFLVRTSAFFKHC